MNAARKRCGQSCRARQTIRHHTPGKLALTPIVAESVKAFALYWDDGEPCHPCGCCPFDRPTGGCAGACAGCGQWHRTDRSDAAGARQAESVAHTLRDGGLRGDMHCRSGPGNRRSRPDPACDLRGAACRGPRLIGEAPSAPNHGAEPFSQITAKPRTSRRPGAAPCCGRQAMPWAAARGACPDS